MAITKEPHRKRNVFDYKVEQLDDNQNEVNTSGNN